jgi:hypothetical protein
MHLPLKSLRPVRRPSTAVLAALILGLALVESSPAQNANPPTAPEPAKGATSEMEAKFIATMTNATLKGRTSFIKDGQLGPEKGDSYEIVGVTKGSGDRWTINARLSYAGQSLVLPVPAQVKWAGDTPVLIVDNLSLGIGPSYSARVMIYEKTYAGSWSGGGEGGLLSGIITNGK